VPTHHKVAPEDLDDDGMIRIVEAYADDPTSRSCRASSRRRATTS